MNQPEFWELPDADVWAQVDAAWLLEQFRRNEVSEERAHRQALMEAQPGRWLADLADLVWAYARAAQECRITGPDLSAYFAVMAAPPRLVEFEDEPRALLAPPTWTALPAPCALSRARLRDWHAALHRRPRRTPATRRCS